jgi:2Fe-2S iron-sulfur cluster binding domain
MSFEISVDGTPVTAEPGRTVAGVLLALGKDSWRDTRRNARPRGVFCGIGVCFDCLVVVNAVPDVRACQRTVVPGDDIRTQHGAELPGAGES